MNIDNWLLVDIGNSFIKVRWTNGQGKHLPSVIPPLYVDLTELKKMVVKSKGVMVSCVAKNSLLKTLHSICLENNILFIEPSKKKQYQGVTYAYENINSLGIDRWINIFASAKIFGRDCVIISLGTAVTIDYVTDNGVHIGGWIAPGLSTLSKALLNNTSRIEAKSRSSFNLDFGKTTQDCVDSGCAASLLGTIKYAIDRAKLEFDQPSIIITGGDRELAKFLDEPTITVENLVLDGLELLLASQKNDN